MSDAQHHAIAWFAYVLLLLAGVVIWLILPPAAVEIVRWGAPAWWVLATVMVSHHWHKHKDA